MVVEMFFNAFVGNDGRPWRDVDGVWTFPKFMVGYRVWAYGRPATIVGYVDNGEKTCGAHPGDYRYQVRFESTGETWTPWPYCESQLTSRE